MKLTVNPEYRKFSNKRVTELYVQIKLETPQKSGRPRPPFHLALILDTSGSMAGENLTKAKEAATDFIHWLTRKDFATILTFDNKVSTVAAHQPLFQKDAVAQSISHISAFGSTNLSAGWLAGLSQLRRNYHQDEVYRAILLTDGIANLGITDHNDLFEIARLQREENIITTTVGFGDEFDEDLLTGIAKHGGGNFYYVDKPEGLAHCFQDIFGSVVSLFGQNLSISVNTQKEVRITEVLSDCHTQISPNEMHLSFGDVHADEVIQLMFKVALPAHMPEKKATIGEVTVQFDQVIGAIETREHKAPIELNVTSITQRDEDVQREVWMAKGIQLRVAAMQSMLKTAEKQKIVRLLQEHSNEFELFTHPTARLTDERFKLMELASHLGRGDLKLPSFRKELSQTALHTSKSGTTDLVDTKRIEVALGFDELDQFRQLSQQIERMMDDKGYNEDHITRVRIVLEELGTNAFNHGCPDKNSGLVHFRCEMAQKYVRVTIEDNGNGFDYKKALETAHKNFVSIKRTGRGLVLAEQAADTLTFSKKGCCVEAMVQNRNLVKSALTSSRAEIEHAEDLVIVRIKGRIDSENYGEIEGVFEELLSEGWTRVVVDFGHTDYISSVGFGIIGSLGRQIKKRSGALVITHVSNVQWKSFALFERANLINILPTCEDAVRFIRDQTETQSLR